MIRIALFIALMALASLNNLFAQRSSGKAPDLTSNYITTITQVFPQIKNQIATLLETEYESDSASINHIYRSFTDNKEIANLIMSNGGKKNTINDLFITITGFSVLLLDEDLEQIRQELGLKIVTAQDIVAYMANGRDIGVGDTKALEESLERYEQVREWIGHSNMIRLSEHKNIIKELMS